MDHSPPPTPVDNRYSQGAVTGDGNAVTQHFHAAQRARVEWPAWCGNPPVQAACLQPRPEQTAKLERALAPGRRPAGTGTAVLTSVLSGMGGVGKTQLAAQYFRRWRAGPGGDGLALWVTASNREAVISAYAAAALEVADRDGRSVPKDPAGRAEWLRSWLSSTHRRWLVVLDDLADPADLSGLWPEGAAGACLVTSRRTDAALRQRGRVMVSVGLFTPEQSHSYLSDRFAELAADTPGVLDDAEGLAEDLQRLPLALAHAAAFIADYGETCRGYRRRLADRRTTLAELFPAAEAADDYQHTVGATWSISIDAANRLHPVGAARPLLEIASLLDPNGLPREVLTSQAALAYATATMNLPPERAQESSPARAVITEQQGRDALANLARLSLLELNGRGGPRAVRVHAMIQRATRDYTTDRKQTAQAAADALLEAWTKNPYDATVTQAYRDNTLALASHEPDALWEPDGHTVLFRAGRSLGDAGQVGAACVYWAQMVDTARQKLGADHPDTLAARGDLALWRGKAGDPAGAATATEELLSDLQRVLGADHPDTLATRANLALWRGQAGDPAGASTAFEELLFDVLRVLGPDHRDTLIARGNLALWCGEAGDPAGAATATEELLSDLQRVLGADHPDTLATRAHLALWRGQAGDPSGAATAFEELLSDRLRVLGPDHPDTLATRAHLALWRGQAGDPSGAATAFEELLSDRLRVLGPDHPDTLTTHGHLARWRGQAGDPSGAATAIEELLSDRLRVLGPDHPDTLTTRAHLASWCGQAGDPSGAATAFEALLFDVLRVLGPDHPDTLTTRANLAYWRGQAGDPSGAATAFEALLFDVLRVLGPDHPDTLTTRANLAYWREQAGHLARATTATEELLSDRLRVLGADHPDTLTTRGHLAAWRGQAGDPAGAAISFEELLSDVLRVLGPDHPDTLSTRYNLAYWREQAGDPAGAAAAYEQLLSDLLGVLGPDHPDTLTTRHNLGYWRGQAGDPAGAATAFEELLSDRLRVLGPKHPDTALTHEQLAYWRERAGDLT